MKASPKVGSLAPLRISLLVLLAISAPLPAQLTNPLPLIEESGLTVELQDWITIPRSAGFANPPLARINHLKPCPDGVRLFCNDLRGKLWVIASSDANRATLFLDFANHYPFFIPSPGFGTGFSSFAFHPEFATVGAPGYGKFYTAHSEELLGSTPPDFVAPLDQRSSQHMALVEWTMTNHEDTALSTEPANFSTRELFRVQFAFDLHGLQELAFDPNAGPGSDNYGCLFVCVGEGGSAGNGRVESVGRIDSILGSIIRIVPVLSTGQDAADYLPSKNGRYLIPKSNPFTNSADPTPEDGIGPVKEIYAYGFRNPHRISWDTRGTNKMFCGNIGENNIEEVEVIEPGGHYGWPSREGRYLLDRFDRDFIYPLRDPDEVPPGAPAAPATYSYPAAQFDHDDGRAIVGGYVYRGTRIPELEGMYICGGISRGRIFIVPEADLRLEPPDGSGIAPGILQSVKLHYRGTDYDKMLDFLAASRADLRFGIGHDGELFALSKQNGRIYRINPRPEFGVIQAPKIEVAATFVTLKFKTELNKTYRLWLSEDLISWSPTFQFISGTGNEEHLIDTNPDDKRFYVIEVLDPP